jgi:hypothetical protein
LAPLGHCFVSSFHQTDRPRQPTAPTAGFSRFHVKPPSGRSFTGGRGAKETGKPGGTVWLFSDAHAADARCREQPAPKKRPGKRLAMFGFFRDCVILLEPCEIRNALSLERGFALPME